MDSTTQTHWRKKDNPNYLGAYCMPLPRKDIILTIKEVKWETITGESGKKDNTRIMYFEEAVKPMIVNVTNGRIITSIYKTPAVEEWKGKQIQLYVEWIKDRSSGLSIECLRIRPLIPQKGKPELSLNTPAFDKCKAHISAGGTIEDLEKKYTLSVEVKEALKCN